jgi:hypothetical protein
MSFVLRRLDEEFKECYKEESEKCEDFAVDLMEQCRTFKEIKILTDVIPEFERRKKHIEIRKENAKDLTFLNLAIKGNNEKVSYWTNTLFSLGPSPFLKFDPK